MTDAAGLYRATALMSVGTALSRITGLARVVALTFALGVTGTRLADTYNLANTTPNIIFELFLGGVFTAVFVPVLVEIRARSSDQSPLISTSLVALAVLSALTAVAAPLVMRVYTFRIADPRIRADVLELSSFLLRWFSPQIFFYGLSSIAEALLNVRRRFGAPKFAPVLNNLTAIATLLVFARAFGGNGLELGMGAKTLLGAGTTAGVVLQAVVLLPLLRHERLRFRPSLRDEAVRRVLRLSTFVAGYVIVNQVGLWFVLALATRVVGGVTAYQIAFMFLQLPHGLFTVSLISALLPDLAAAAQAESWDTFRRSLALGIRGVTFLLLPAAVGYVLLAEPITRLLLARGAASAQDAALVAGVLRGFAFGLVSFSVFQLLTRAFYALQDTRTPTLLNASAVAVHTIVNVPLFAWFGVRGLAYGHAIAYTVGGVALLAALRRRIGGIGGEHLGGLVPIAIGSAIVGIIVAAVSGILGGSDLVRTVVAVGAGAVGYLAFSQVAGVPERGILLGRLGVRGEREERSP